MRTIAYLSPTSISKFRESTLEFYRLYLADIRAPRLAQTEPMAAGSAFDAKVKSELVRRIFGGGDLGRFDFHTMFCKQVEPAQRDFGIGAADAIFRAYESSGALAELLSAIDSGVVAPRFEFTSTSSVEDGVLGDFDGVPLLGKPDLAFCDSAGVGVILDWKVNGYCSRSPTSPKPGYWRLRDKRGVRAHPDFRPSVGAGLVYNTGRPLELVDLTWAQQLAIYGWLARYPVAGHFTTWIEQICNGTPAPWPDLRIASHRCVISEAWQRSLHAEIVGIWGVISSGWIFRDLSEDESRARCAKLDLGLSGESADDAWFNSVTR